MHRRFLPLFAVAIGLLGLVSFARADDLPRGEAKAAGLAPEKLARIEAVLKDTVERKQIAGGSALIARNGKVVFLTTAGLRDVEARQPLGEDTIFRIASMTKPVTSVAVMMLVEEGQIGLSDPIAKYLPEFEKATVLVPTGGKEDMPYRIVPAERPITVLHLLTHTSGISYRFLNRTHLGKLYADAGISDGLAETSGTMADNVRRLAKVPLLHQPGAAWEYGLNTDVLGRLVEVVSGQTLDAFFRARIFKPLGMHDTHFVLPREKRSRLAALYTPGEDRTIRRVGTEPVRSSPLIYSATYPTRDDSKYFSGGAGLVSTAGDYFRFLQMLLQGGERDGVRLLKPETVAQMTRNQLGDLKVSLATPGTGFGYGFGVAMEKARDRKGPGAGSYFWGGIFNTAFWVDPERKLIAVLMTQIYPSNHLKLREEFQRLVYEALAD
jgi:CubicO group peptidase (beta-lactamase class C family)